MSIEEPEQPLIDQNPGPISQELGTEEDIHDVPIEVGIVDYSNGYGKVRGILIM